MCQCVESLNGKFHPEVDALKEFYQEQVSNRDAVIDVRPLRVVLWMKILLFLLYDLSNKCGNVMASVSYKVLGGLFF